MPYCVQLYIIKKLTGIYFKSTEQFISYLHSIYITMLHLTEGEITYKLHMLEKL